MKEKITPSYLKKEDSKNNKIKSKKLNKKNTMCIIITIVLLTLIMSAIILIFNKPDYEKYVAYEEKIIDYGFDTMYDNGTCLTEESVTKSEAIKMIVSAMLNTTDITKMSVTTDKTYSNADYVEYAKAIGIISEDDINEENANDIIKYKELLLYVENAKKTILEKDPTTDVEVKIKNYNRLSSDLQIVIADLVANEIIPNENKSIKLNQEVFKGLLNEILINIAQKFNTITVGDSKLNINPEKVPSNEDEYPYILSNVEKQIYEYEFFAVNQDSFLNPKQAYLIKRDVYSTIVTRVEAYYNFILNVNYETINYDDFYNELCTYCTMKPNEQKIKEYVEYVKNNKIKLSGNAKVQLPAVYMDGEKYRVRTKVSFEILSSDTKNNILVFDEYSNKNFEYSQTKYELIIDTKMLTGYKFNSLYVYPGEFITSVLNENSGINLK